MILVSPNGRTGYIRWLVITWAGIVGFVGLLVLSHYFPTHATLGRILAFVWFVFFGLVRVVNEKRWVRRR